MVKVCLVSMLMLGCAAQKPQKASTSTIIPNRCIVDIQKTPDTICHKDGTKITCSPMKIEYVKGCEILEVHKPK